MLFADIPKIRIKTTLPTRPFTLNSDRPNILTTRLLIRALNQNDLASLHRLRSQPEVMILTSLGRPTRDLAETQTNLDRFLSPNDLSTFNFAICLRETGELVGVGGVHEGRFGDEKGRWPEIGYMLAKEYWGQGFATEFVRGFLGAWWSLPRESVEMEVERDSVERFLKEGEGEDGGVPVVPELLVAIVLLTNFGSLGVVRKSGFEHFRKFEEANAHEGKEMEMIKLGAFSVTRPNSV